MGKQPSIKVLQAYRPVWPPHVLNPPSFRPPPPPKLVPFFKDKRHTVPTKWRLYRDLMRATYTRLVPSVSIGNPASNETDHDGRTRAESSSSMVERTPRRPRRLHKDDGWPQIRRWIREKWKKERPTMTIKRTFGFLAGQYNLLFVLKSTDPSTIASLSQSEVECAALHAEADERARQAEIEAARPPPRARVVGGYVYPSHFFVPMPRLKPQPAHISGMIRKRMKQKERNVKASQVLRQWHQDMRHEQAFLQALGVAPEVAQWGEEMPEFMGYFWDAQKTAEERRNMIFSERDVLRVEKARKEKLKKRMKRLQREREERMLGSSGLASVEVAGEDVVIASVRQEQRGRTTTSEPTTKQDQRTGHQSVQTTDASRSEKGAEQAGHEAKDSKENEGSNTAETKKSPTTNVGSDEGELGSAGSNTSSRKRGRPKKTAERKGGEENERQSQDATGASLSGENQPKRRGRPKKASKES